MWQELSVIADKLSVMAGKRAIVDMGGTCGMLLNAKLKPSQQLIRAITALGGVAGRAADSAGEGEASRRCLYSVPKS